MHGQERRYLHTRIGVGGRMDTLQCAVVLAKLDRFDWEIARRLELGDAYRSKLAAAGIPAEMVTVRPDRNSVWAQLTVKVNNRSHVQQSLQANGVPTAVHYPVPLNMQPAYQHLCCPECTPNSQWAAERVMSLPLSPDLNDETMSRIIVALKQALTA